MARLQTSKEVRNHMALTRDFKETIRARVQRDSTFRKELLREGVENLLAGDVETGKTVLRDYINATIGFGQLAEVTRQQQGVPRNQVARGFDLVNGPEGVARAVDEHHRHRDLG